MKKKVTVAMSGGVDSSVAALLLKEAGYDVTGITMRIWPCESLQRYRRQASKKICCSVPDMEDAKITAAKIGIPHYTIDIRNVFEKEVIAPFCDAYLSGRTPNPCIVCNEKIKFGIFLERAGTTGTDLIATGHYARISKTKRGPVLKKAADKKNDQSYWLYSVGPERLAKVVFPLGGLTKEKVRQIARRHGLPVADKPKSREICFIPDNDYRSFIKKFTGVKPEPGNVIDSSGKVIGKHSGFFNYTIGQRHGLITSTGKKMYVMGIVPGKNIVIAGTEQETFGKHLTAVSVKLNPALTNPGDISYNVCVKIRNQHNAAPARLFTNGISAKAEIVFKEPQRSITPGQAAVFYNGDRVMGGGIICDWKRQ